MKSMLIGLWQYRNFILTSIRNEFVTRFVRSRLGAAWVILNPLAMVLIYALVLSRVLSAKLPGIDNTYAYTIYLMAGMLSWNLFTEIFQRCLGVFIENGELIKKISFPKLALPVIAVGASLINYLILLVVVVFVFGVLGHFPFQSLIWLPLLTLLIVIFSVGLGIVFGVLNVFIRDIGQAVPIILQLLFWLTPVVYPTNIVPEKFQQWLHWNPLFHLVESFHNVLAYDQSPALWPLLWIALFSIGLMVIGFILFRKAAPEMVDML